MKLKSLEDFFERIKFCFSRYVIVDNWKSLVKKSYIKISAAKKKNNLGDNSFLVIVMDQLVYHAHANAEMRARTRETPQTNKSCVNLRMKISRKFPSISFSRQRRRLLYK